MSFLVDILRPTPGEGPQWYHLLKKASGGCNDLMYSGHMLVSVLTAMAWTVCYTQLSGATTFSPRSVFHSFGQCFMIKSVVIDGILIIFMSVSHT
jgi:hypothetical protein